MRLNLNLTLNYHTYLKYFAWIFSKQASNPNNSKLCKTFHEKTCTMVFVYNVYILCMLLCQLQTFLSSQQIYIESSKTPIKLSEVESIKNLENITSMANKKKKLSVLTENKTTFMNNIRNKHMEYDLKNYCLYHQCCMSSLFEDCFSERHKGRIYGNERIPELRREGLMVVLIPLLSSIFNKLPWNRGVLFNYNTSGYYENMKLSKEHENEVGKSDESSISLIPLMSSVLKKLLWNHFAELVRKLKFITYVLK